MMQMGTRWAPYQKALLIHLQTRSQLPQWWGLLVLIQMRHQTPEHCHQNADSIADQQMCLMENFINQPS